MNSNTSRGFGEPAPWTGGTPISSHSRKRKQAEITAPAIPKRKSAHTVAEVSHLKHFRKVAKDESEALARAELLKKPRLLPPSSPEILQCLLSFPSHEFFMYVVFQLELGSSSVWVDQYIEHNITDFKVIKDPSEMTTLDYKFYAKNWITDTDPLFCIRVGGLPWIALGDPEGQEFAAKLCAIVAVTAKFLYQDHPKCKGMKGFAADATNEWFQHYVLGFLNAKVAKEGQDFQLFVKTFADKINDKIQIIERGNGMANDHMDKCIVDYDEATIKEHFELYEELHEVVVDQILKGNQQDAKPAAESAPEPAPAAESPPAPEPALAAENPLAVRLLDIMDADKKNEAARIANEAGRIRNESAKIALDAAKQASDAADRAFYRELAMRVRNDNLPSQP